MAEAQVIEGAFEEGQEIDRDELILKLLTDAHQKPPDTWTQIRQWIGLIIALGGMAWLVSAGRQIGQIENAVEQNGRMTEIVRGEFHTFVQESRHANENLAKILQAIEARTSRLEGLDEGQRRGAR